MNTRDMHGWYVVSCAGAGPESQTNDKTCVLDYY